MILPGGVRFNWRKFIIAFVVIYTIFYVFTLPSWFKSLFQTKSEITMIMKIGHSRLVHPNITDIKINTDSKKSKNNTNVKHTINETKPASKESFLFVYKGQNLYITDVLTAPGMPNLKERLKTPKMTSVKRIFSESDFREANLGGCPDWKCEITYDHNNANAFINAYPPANTSFNGYVLFSTQESPVNYGAPSGSDFNMSIGFRHDSPTASPYVASESSFPKSQPLRKTLGAVWFVSHCTTNSKRESLVSSLKKYFNVDSFGACARYQCPKLDKCENKINTEYHFYMALENSICKDYITEKLWHQSYLNTVIPVVLKRKLVEPYVPPNSFIAFDDYKSVKEMAEHMKKLMNNKTEYIKYFDWRQKYEVIFLDGKNHDKLERPWGLCQLCRLLHLNPLSQYRIDNMDEYWKNTCEVDGQLAKEILN
ncbi:Glyco-tran-10-N domain-containing protein [Aphelenchoides bicaudatus]|nr:Glyco-tran-10-N domain-containing protein [Aphelenchoides bicaudatus]